MSEYAKWCATATLCAHFFSQHGEKITRGANFQRTLPSLKEQSFHNLLALQQTHKSDGIKQSGQTKCLQGQWWSVEGHFLLQVRTNVFLDRNTCPVVVLASVV